MKTNSKLRPASEAMVMYPSIEEYHNNGTFKLYHQFLCLFVLDWTPHVDVSEHISRRSESQSFWRKICNDQSSTPQSCFQGSSGVWILNLTRLWVAVFNVIMRRSFLRTAHIPLSCCCLHNANVVFYCICISVFTDCYPYSLRWNSVAYCQYWFCLFFSLAESTQKGKRMKTAASTVFYNSCPVPREMFCFFIISFLFFQWTIYSCVRSFICVSLVCLSLNFISLLNSYLNPPFDDLLDPNLDNTQPDCLFILWW